MTLTAIPEHLKPMVEKAALAVATDLHEMKEYGIDGADAYAMRKEWFDKQATVSILAFLNTCLESRVAREAGASVMSSGRWAAYEGKTAPFFPALIIRMGDKP
jgi:hypothetical protein